ncbi:glycoside hydrolase family 13 protein [Mycoplasma mycoides]|uniref:glycoside hydrolase family 13 protein n=1 Tax=Mycoplasma mycoides TaxID=2102 RepID=UPI00224018D3|nr:glycoside hydrolase family 13 protein [Mycoplasma mycoides]QVK05369.1 alpha-glycosidase [Mycoplasma mycoides subsp. capri]
MKVIDRVAIHHQQRSNMAYCYDKDYIHIILRTKKDDLKKVVIHHGDPFLRGHYLLGSDYIDLKPKEMTKSGSTKLYDYWFVEVKPEFKRLTYFFELFGIEDDHCYFGEKGFYETDDFKMINTGGWGFNYAWMNPNDVYQAPDWINDTIWYQIFPERFANGNKNNDPKNTLAWNSTDPSYDSFFGGDLQGIIDHLDHLVELGANGLYLCPIFKAKSNHKYDTIDYLQIDPNFGDKKTFKKLVEECHKRNIKIMLDAVFNHAGYWNKFWQDVLKNQENSKYKDWFYINKFPLQEKIIDKNNQEKTVNNYYTFAFHEVMPKINTTNKDAKKYLLKVANYWIKEFDIDAWRLDAANEVDHEFWRDFRKTVNKNKPIYILGEIWGYAHPWLKGDQFDGVTNYMITSPICELVTKWIKPSKFNDKTTEVLNNYPRNVFKGMLNCLTSHDTTRLLTLCNNDVRKFKLAYSLVFMLAGAPSIYYGDEIGLDGAHDPLNRKCMNWNKDQWNHEIFNYLKKLIQIRKQNPVLGSYGTLKYTLIDDDKNYLEFIKYDDNNTYLILVNNSDEKLEVKKEELVNKIDLISDQIQNNNIVSLDPISMKVFKIK